MECWEKKKPGNAYFDRRRDFENLKKKGQVKRRTDPLTLIKKKKWKKNVSKKKKEESSSKTQGEKSSYSEIPGKKGSPSGRKHCNEPKN